MELRHRFQELGMLSTAVETELLSKSESAADVCQLIASRSLVQKQCAKCIDDLREALDAAEKDNERLRRMLQSSPHPDAKKGELQPSVHPLLRRYVGAPAPPTPPTSDACPAATTPTSPTRQASSSPSSEVLSLQTPPPGGPPAGAVADERPRSYTPQQLEEEGGPSALDVGDSRSQRFPYDGVELDQHSTFLHRLLHCLQHGTGATVLEMVCITPEAKKAIVRESGTSEGLASLVEAILMRMPCRVLLLEFLPPAAPFQDWRSVKRTQRSNEQHQRQALLDLPPTPPPRLRFTEDCVPGILNFLIREGQRVPSTASSQASREPVELAYASGARASSFFFTQGDRPGDWVALSVAPWVVCLCGYALSSYHPLQCGSAPRNWELQGSFDGQRWTTLSQHRDDNTISGKVDFGMWRIDPMASIPSRYFRVVATGPNAMGSLSLQVSHVELYGRALYVEDVKGEFVNAGTWPTAPLKATAIRRPRDFAQLKPTPEPVTKRGKRAAR